MSKPTITKKEFKQRVDEEAKRMQADLKSQGANWPISHCKREAAKVFKDEFIIC